MKRKFAVIMSAALAAGSTMPVMAESETAFTPSTYVGEFSLTADGESMLFSVTAEQFAEDGVSVSANVTLPASVTGEEADFDVDSMMNDFTALAENFDIQTAEDGSTTITFDGPAIVNTVKAVENVVDNAMSVLVSQVQGTDASQLVTVFDDYLQAAAEGVNMASPDVSVEDAKGMIVDMMNSLVEEMVSSFDVTPL